jgi:hypothetical protein
VILPIPVIGLFTQVGFLQKKLVFETRLVGFGSHYSNYDFKVIDAYAELKGNITKLISIGLGYKIVDFEVEKKNSNDSLVNLNVAGYYLFASIEF